MPAKKGGLGRGFDALFNENATEEISKNNVVTLSISEIEPNRNQPRSFFDDTSLKELSDSIAEFGVIQPLLVRPLSDGGYQIVAGERRWRAARMAGLTELPVVIRALDDKEAAELALIENLQREDLNPVEEAVGIDRLIKEFGLTQEEAAERLSKSRPAVTNILRLLSLPDEILEYVKLGKLSSGHARTLLGLADLGNLIPAAKSVMENKLSVRDTEKIVKKLNGNKPSGKNPLPGDVFYRETELSLRNCLGRRVSVFEGKNGGGRIEIEFFDKDDLKKIAKLFEE